MALDDSAPLTHGAAGERIAALFLESRGYAILARNFRVNRREIDLVAERGRLLVAVEVKWRRAGDAFGGAALAWRPAQRARAGEAWLLACATFPGGETRPWRFDLVTIEEDAIGLRLEHRRGAWRPAGGWW